MFSHQMKSKQFMEDENVDTVGSGINKNGTLIISKSDAKTLSKGKSDYTPIGAPVISQPIAL